MNREEYENLTKALAIYKSLVGSENGYIEKKGNESLFSDYQDEGVSEVLNIISTSMQLNIFRGKNGRLYIISESDSVLAKSENDVKSYFYNSNENRSERAYLFYYATLLLINELFGGNPIRQRRDYLPLKNWIDIIDTDVEKHKTLTLEEEMELGFNFVRVGRRWKGLSQETDSSIVKSINTKSGFLEKCLQFLVKEDLVESITEDELRIYPKEKLIDLIERGNLRVDRLQELKISDEQFEDQE